MKDSKSSLKKEFCRLFLQLGSGVFLLFFTCFSVALPGIVQIGSAVFLFLVIVFSPSVQSAAKSDIEQYTPGNEPSAQYLIQEQLDCEYDLILPDARRQRNSQQLWQTAYLTFYTTQISPAASWQIKLFDILRSDKPEKWRNSCQPVRAGPPILL